MFGEGGRGAGAGDAGCECPVVVARGVLVWGCLTGGLCGNTIWLCETEPSKHVTSFSGNSRWPAGKPESP